MTEQERKQAIIDSIKPRNRWVDSKEHSEPNQKAIERQYEKELAMRSEVYSKESEYE